MSIRSFMATIVILDTILALSVTIHFAYTKYLNEKTENKQLAYHILYRR